MTEKVETITVYVSIGNSDDKLTQAEWARFAEDATALIFADAAQVHGHWFSAPDSPYQNACIAAAITPANAELLRKSLTGLRTFYRQDSIAWAVVTETEFI